MHSMEKLNQCCSNLKKNTSMQYKSLQLVCWPIISLWLCLWPAYLLTVDGVVCNKQSLYFKVCYVSLKTPILFSSDWFVVINDVSILRQNMSKVKFNIFILYHIQDLISWRKPTEYLYYQCSGFRRNWIAILWRWNLPVNLCTLFDLVPKNIHRFP